MPNILGHAKNILEAEEKQRALFWILHKLIMPFMETTCFSATVRQCNIAYSVVHVQLYFEIFSNYSANYY